MKLTDRRLLELLDRRSLSELDVPDKKILVGISGGADSVAMLRALAIYAAGSSNLKIAAVHINHGLRVESCNEEDFVIRLCQNLDIGLTVHNLALGPKPQRTSPEQFWREERYKAFAVSLAELEADYLALGHTADDLAETFLYHLARGTGPEGLAFHFFKVSSVGELPIIRPLWKTRRKEIEQALTGVNQQWIDDPSNLEVRYSRNRIRQEVIPALEKINSAAVTAIVSLADQLTGYVGKPNAEEPPDALRMEISSSVRSLPYNNLCHTVHEFLCSDGKLSHSTRHIEQAADMIRDNTSGIVALPDSQNLIITQEHAWIYKGTDPTNIELAREHCRRFHEFAVDFSAHKLETAPEGEYTALDGQIYEIDRRLPASIKMRNRLPGDRIGPKSLKKLLIDYRIPWYLRDYLVLAATAEGQIVGLISSVRSLTDWVKHHTIMPVELSFAKIKRSA